MSSDKSFAFWHALGSEPFRFPEDNRDDLIALVAGTTGKMKTLLASNPGLRSRCNKYFGFADYDSQQLVEIFELFCAEAGFRLTASSREKVATLVDSLYAQRRQLWQRSARAQTLRAGDATSLQSDCHVGRE